MTEFARDMVRVITPEAEGWEIAVRVARAILRYFGGQLLYFPRPDNTEGSKPAAELFGVIEDETNTPQAERILRAFLREFGGGQLYIPLEHVAFRDEIANEIYERYNGTSDRMAELCREFRISFNQVYRLCRHGQQRRADSLSPSLFD